MKVSPSIIDGETDPSRADPPIQVSGAEFLAGSIPEHVAEPMVLDVWVIHMDIISIFQLCCMHGIGTMSKIYWLGFTASEIKDAINLAGIKSEDVFDIAADLSIMGKAVAKAMNK